MSEIVESEVKMNVSAPVFNLVDVFGREVNLESYRGNKVFIGFFRHAGCPFCNLRVHALMKYYTTNKFGSMKMVFFFESKENTIKNSSLLSGVSPVPVISDHAKVWYNIYGIEDSIQKSSMSHLTTFIQTAVKAKMNNLPIHLMADGESFGTMPAEFLLDENLVIRKMYYSKRLADRMDIEHIVDFCDTDHSTLL